MIEGTNEFARGWKVVLAAAIGIGTGLSPLPYYTIGVFVQPLSAEFGWRVDQVLAALIVTTLAVLVSGPLVGVLADRLGVRRIALASTVLFGLAFLFFALNPGSLAMFYGNYALLAVAGAGTLPITWTRGVNGWFDRRRGLALGIALVGTGLFGSLAKLYANELISLAGWRWAFAGLAGFPLMLSLPVAWFCFHERGNGAPADDVADAAGTTLKDALRTRRFWTMALAFCVITGSVGGIIPNLERLFASKGFEPNQAVALASIVGVSVVIGRLAGGWLIDRFWAPAVAFVIVSAPALAFVLMIGSALETPVAAASVFLIGFASGVEYDVLAYFVSRYFGTRFYASIYGALYAAFVLGAGFGPYLYGRVFAAEQSYDPALGSAAILLLFGAGILLTLGPYPRPSPSPSTTRPDPAGATS